MTNNFFYQAIDRTFPQLNKEMKDKIYTKVLDSLALTLKKAVFAGNPTGLAVFNNRCQRIADINERSRFYGQSIVDKMIRLPRTKQRQIGQIYLTEMTNIMHTIYQRVNA